MSALVYVAGTWQRIKALRYLVRECLGMRPFDRTQSVTLSSFEAYFRREVARFTRKTPRIARKDGRFSVMSTIELETEFVRTHVKGLESALGGRDVLANVLEVGAGYCRTLIPLSLLMPNAKFSGIEYTTAGPASAQRYWREARLEIEQIASPLGQLYRKDPPWHLLATGDGKALPYADREFDVAYTNLVLEQIPYRSDNERVIHEMRRVVRRAACFLEPWDEAQSTSSRAYVRQIGYFAEKAKILKEIGFKRVEYKTLDFQHNLLFGLGYAVAYVD
jgi:SAM-dependent methyltransferase